MTHRPQLLKTLGELYESEIAAGIASMWDNGFTIWIGDDLNGRKVERTFHRGERKRAPDTFRTWDGVWTAAAEWLTRKRCGFTRNRTTPNGTPGERKPLAGKGWLRRRRTTSSARCPTKRIRCAVSSAWSWR